MLLLGRASTIIDFSNIGKLSNLCFCLPRQTKSLIFLMLASSQIYAFACQGTQNRWFFVYCQALNSMLLLARTNKIIDFSYIGKLSNQCFCLPKQTKSLICLTLASSQIYAFACQGRRNQWFCLHWQALKSMLLLAKANKTILFSYIRQLSNLCFCRPTQTKSWILIHWQALKSMLLLAMANNIIDFSDFGKLSNLCICLPEQTRSLMFLTLASSQIYAFCLSRQTKSLIFLILTSSGIYAFACQRKQNQWLFLHWQALKSMLLLTKAHKSIGFSYIGKLSNLCFCLSRQTKSLILLTLASSQIHAFACQGKRNHWFFYNGKLSNVCFCLSRRTKSWIFLTMASSQIGAFACHGNRNHRFFLHWQALKSMLLLAKANKIIDFSYIGKLPNLWVCLPRQSQSSVFLTLASSQIYAFACQGKQNHWFVLRWQTLKSMFCLPCQTKALIFLTLASSQIYAFACRRKQTHWFFLHQQTLNQYPFACQGTQNYWWFFHIGKLSNLCWWLPGQKTHWGVLHWQALKSMLLLAKATNIMVILTWASSQIYAFACHGEQKHWFFLHWQALKSMLVLARATQINDFSYIGKLSNLCFCLTRLTKSSIFLTLASSQIYAFACQIVDFSSTGKLSNLCFCLPRQTQALIFSYIGKLSNRCFCLPRQTKSLIFLTLASSQIYAFACQGKQNHWVFLHWEALKSMLLLAKANEIVIFAYIGKLSNLCFCLPGHKKSLSLLTVASSQLYAFGSQGKQNHWFFIHCQAPKSMLLLARTNKIIDLSYIGKL